jgi:integrase
MSLQNRNGTWWIDVRTPSGKRIRRSARTSDKALAQEYHDKVKHDQWRIERLGEKPRRLWQEAAVKWLAMTEEKRDHLKDVGKLRWLDQHLRDYYLDQIDRDVIDRIAQIKKLEASAPTANRHLALIRSILRAARDEWDWIDKVPKVRLYTESQKRVRWLKPEEAARLMKELPEHLAVLMAFTLCTGLRQRNCSYLRWDQVDLERGTAWIFADQIKNKRNLAVPLNAQARKILVSQMGKHDTWCFPYQGEPVARCSTKAWEKAKERAGIENFRWHDLRHTWASWHVQGGTTLHELQELGGWSSFLMVQRYAHLGSDHLKNAASRIEDVFGHDLDTMTHGRKLRLVVSH